MESHVDGARGAAMSRRQPRLRAQWHREQQTITMAVCAALHYRGGLCKGQQNNVPWHQKTQTAERPGVPPEVEPQVLGVRCSSGGNGDGPALSFPLFSDGEYDTVDASTLKFLMTLSLVAKNEEFWCANIMWLMLLFRCALRVLLRHLLCLHVFLFLAAWFLRFDWPEALWAWHQPHSTGPSEPSTCCVAFFGRGCAMPGINLTQCAMVTFLQTVSSLRWAVGMPWNWKCHVPQAHCFWPSPLLLPRQVFLRVAQFCGAHSPFAAC